MKPQFILFIFNEFLNNCVPNYFSFNSNYLINVFSQTITKADDLDYTMHKKEHLLAFELTLFVSNNAVKNKTTHEQNKKV